MRRSGWEEQISLRSVVPDPDVRVNPVRLVRIIHNTSMCSYIERSFERSTYKATVQSVAGQLDFFFAFLWGSVVRVGGAGF